MSKLKVYTDGGARGNPGPAGIGAVIYDEQGKELARISEFIGIATNNQAEYRAAIEALKLIQKEYTLPVELEFYVDSELLAKQFQGLYKVKNDGLKPLYLQIQQLCPKIGNVKFNHISRSQNKLADKLVNEAIDKGTI